MTAIDAGIWTPDLERRRRAQICPRCKKRKLGPFESLRARVFGMPVNGCCCGCVFNCGTCTGTQPSATVSGTGGSGGICTVNGTYSFTSFTSGSGNCAWDWTYPSSPSTILEILYTPCPSPQWIISLQVPLQPHTSYIKQVFSSPYTCGGDGIIRGTVVVPATPGIFGEGCTGSATVVFG